ncbi:MAG: NAD-dependent epimerase/dehydratase family protein [Sphingomicrobium sp.]
MRIIVTGVGGFVGRALVERLVPVHEVVGIDTAPMPAGCRAVIGDLTDRAVLDAAFEGGCDAVVHLATVPGGAAEADPALARRINLDATFDLADGASAAGCGRFLFASSIAVFGDPLPDHVDDDTPLAPRLLYGAHKAIAEAWLATLSRRGSLDALSLRLPGIVARPRGSATMKSAFMSDLFHALRAGERFTVPVSPGATMWLMSRARLVDNLVLALDLDAAQLPNDRAVTLPALRVSMASLVAEIAAQAGADAGLVDYAPDAALEAAFGAQPPLETPRADARGLIHDGSLAHLVANVLADLSTEPA